MRRVLHIRRGKKTPFDTTPKYKPKRTKDIKAIASSLHFVSFLTMTGLVKAGSFANSTQHDIKDVDSA